MINKGQTVWSCVATNFATAEIFKKHKIDFCCWWEISIEEACKKQNIDLKNIWQNREEVFELVKNDFSLENLKDYYK